MMAKQLLALSRFYTLSSSFYCLLRLHFNLLTQQNGVKIHTTKMLNQPKDSWVIQETL
jgi:hypothetical protein